MNLLDLPERLLDKIEALPDAPGCWLWTGSTNAAGYGTVGYRHEGKKFYLAHRLVYTMLRGPIPDDKRTLDHRCRVRGCVNPWHLVPATDSENVHAPGSRAIAHLEKVRTHCLVHHGEPLVLRPGYQKRACLKCVQERSRKGALAYYYRNRERLVAEAARKREARRLLRPPRCCKRHMVPLVKRQEGSVVVGRCPICRPTRREAVTV